MPYYCMKEVHQTDLNKHSSRKLGFESTVLILFVRLENCCLFNRTTNLKVSCCLKRTFFLHSSLYMFDLQFFG